MTKPTSWCIDIRQEHPLLEKFLKYYMKKLNMVSITADTDYVGEWEDANFMEHIITLDERRERRGKEYFEWQLKTCKACLGKKQHSVYKGGQRRGGQTPLGVCMKNCERCDGIGVEPNL